ncbi:MAG TPA: hypothetical protein VGM11_15635 [Acidobacteriaceae bacterium]|jgi:hypothetical protein
MVAYGSILFVVLLVSGIVGLYLYTRPARIVVTTDPLIIHSAYKNYTYPRKGLVYKGEVPREIWSRGLYRKFGDGWPLALAGRFHNTGLGDVVIVSMKRPEVLQRFDVDGKILLLQLSADEARALSPFGIERNT